MMGSGQLSRSEALARAGCRHACHVMLYSDTQKELFCQIPLKHIVLMQMRFDGLLGFPGGFVNPSEESLEEGLNRELLEEIGMAVPISVENHVDSCEIPASSTSPGLILHFYAIKLEEGQILELERTAASTAIDHGHEVLGMVRVPLYRIDGAGLSSFLSHAFIGNARQQLLNCLLRFDLVSPQHLHQALCDSLLTHKRTAEDVSSALALLKEKLQ